MKKVETRLRAPLVYYLFLKHRERPHPSAEIAVERAIDDMLLKRFAMPRNAEHSVEITFEMPVYTGA